MANLQINASLNTTNTLANIVNDVDKKINPQIQANSKARVKLVGSLDISKTIKTINANLQNINKDLKVQISNVSFAPINTVQLQNNINQATSGVKANVNIAPVLDRKSFSDTESYIKEIIKQLSNPNIANNINFNTMFKGLKESFGLAGNEIKTELSNFIQALKLTPNDKQTILSSYENLMGAIENASGVAHGKDFTENISDAIYRLATALPEVSNKAKQATQTMTEGLNQTAQAAEQANNAMQKISTGATGNPNYIYQSNQSLIESIKYLDAESNAIERVQNEFLSLSNVTGVTTSEIAKDSDTVVAFTANVTNSEGALERFRYALQDITTEEEKAQGQESVFKYVLQDITAADAGIKKLEESAKRWADTTSAEANKVQGQIDRLKSSWITAGSGKTVTSQEGLDKLSAQYDVVVQHIEKLRNAKQDEYRTIKAQTDNEVKELNRLVALYVHLENPATSLRAKDLDTNIQIMANSITAFENKVKSSSVPVQKMQGDINNLNKDFIQLKDTFAQGKIDEANKQFNALQNSISVAESKLKSLRSSMQSNKSAQKLAGDIAILTAQIKQFRASNSRSEGKFGAEYDALLQKLKQNPDVSGLYAIRQEFRKLQGDVRAAGLTGMTFFDTFKRNISKMSSWLGVSSLGMLVGREIRQMFSDVVKLDEALVDLKKTYKGTEESLKDFYYEANNVARQLGVTTEAVIQSSANWSRLGYSTAESAKNMAEAAAIFSAISPGLDVDAATDGLIAVLQGFKEIDDSNVIDDVLSKINIIGNNMPVSNADIIEFLRRSSAAMSEAGNNLSEVIAMGTAITSVTRDAAGAGTALKTMAMRIQGIDEETEEYSEDVAILTGKIADLTKTASNPAGISIFTDETRTQYKSTLDIILDISEVYDELNEKQQAALREALGGKRQGQMIAALIRNSDQIRESLELMENSEGKWHCLIVQKCA